MTDVANIAQLSYKDLRGMSSVQEKEELKDWINQSDANKEFMSTDMQPESVLADAKALLEKNDDRMRRKFEERKQPPSQDIAIQQDIPTQQNTAISGPKNILWQRTLTVAAVIFVILAAVYLWQVTAIKRAPLQLADLSVKLQQIGNSPDRPRLSLSGGDTVFLDKVPKKVVLEKGGWRVSQPESQHIVFSALQATAGEQKAGPELLSFSIPYGQSWKVSLPDGSQAQLNAGSSLLFAVNAPGTAKEERMMALNGEAWLDVTSNPRAPFAVATKKGVITVMGTRFNIRDYAREDDLRVTLLSGSVTVSNGKNNTTLRPGQEAKIDSLSAGIQVVTGVDTAKRLEWRSPYFNFIDQDIRQVMQQLTQWYGMDGTTFRRKIDTVSRNIFVGGDMDKEKTLPEVLHKLTAQTDLHFRVEGKMIIVTP